jgi:hypothetical protein
MSDITVNIYYNKTCYGLSVDARIIRKLCINSGTCGKSKIRELDFNEAPVWADIAFHLETPVAQVMGFAHVNILLVNAEQWISEVYDSYLSDFDRVIFRSIDDLLNFIKDREKVGGRTDNFIYLPWCCDISENSWKNNEISTDLKKRGLISFLGKNEYKYEWMKDFLAAAMWQADYPRLTIYTSQPEFASELKTACLDASNVVVECASLNEEHINSLQWLYYGQLVCSRGEGFGYSAAEAEARGAHLFLSELPVFWNYYMDNTCCDKESSCGICQKAVTWIPTVPIELSSTCAPKARRGLRYQLMGPDTHEEARTQFRSELMKVLEQPTLSVEERKARAQNISKKRLKTCQEFFQERIVVPVKKMVEERRPVRGNWHCPPVLSPDDCPSITIITPTRNRRKLIDIAFHNLLMTDYPLKKIEWIVIEDSNNELGASDKIINFQMNCPDLKVRYIPLGQREQNDNTPWPIGQKRNLAIENATNDIILFMDDDDHYPATSFRRRVAWLLHSNTVSKERKKICGCSTLALYDLQKGVSAVNVPPWDIPQRQRVSEATLTFFKSAWIERKFPEISVAEGEDWLRGREEQFFEIPPQQIIVAFSHGGNSTSRQVPNISKPNGCFWGFPPPYLRFVHGLIGVEIENSAENQVVSKRDRTRR